MNLKIIRVMQVYLPPWLALHDTTVYEARIAVGTSRILQLRFNKQHLDTHEQMQKKQEFGSELAQKQAEVQVQKCRITQD